MKLSVCMMVKNEEKYLEKCLASMQPLLDEIDSELIIVDTGSTDRTVEIARKFTDKVYFHQWNNNFSEMRNITISYATGEWIMYVDGDEAFENVDNIIKFLKLESSSKFNTGTVKIINITVEDKDSLNSFFVAPRIFKNDGTFRFEGAVHNAPIFKQPIIDLQTDLIHYGYVSTDKELMDRKFKRTATILKDELQKNPNNIYYRFQLSVSYLMHEDFNEALEEANKAYELIKDDKIKSQKYIYVFGQLAKCYLVNGMYSDCEVVGKQGLILYNDYIDLHFHIAQSQMALEKYDEAIAYYNNYLMLCNNFEDTSAKQDYRIVNYTLNLYEMAYYNIAVIYFKQNRLNEAIEYLFKIHSKEFIEKALLLIIEISIDSKKFQILMNFYNSNIKNQQEQVINKFFSKIEAYILEFYHEKDITFYNTLKEFPGVYGDLNKIRAAFIQNNSEIINLINNFICNVDFNSGFDYYGDVIYYCMIINKSLISIIDKISEDNLDIYMNYIAKKYDDFQVVLSTYLKNVNISTKNEELTVYNIIKKYLQNNSELESYKNQVKQTIFKFINKNQLDDAKKLISQYEKMIKDDLDIFSAKSVMFIRENNLYDAEKVIKEGLEVDGDNFDLLYNLAYVYDLSGNYSMAINFYNKAKCVCNENTIIEEINKAIKIIENKFICNNLKKNHENHEIEIPIDENIMKDFENKQYRKVIDEIDNLIKFGKYDKVVDICNYWIKNVDKNTGAIYYFLGVANNALNNFDKALMFHKKALEIDNNLADIRSATEKYKYHYNEEKTACIGCGCEDYDVVWVGNQSVSESNKGLINPIRIWVKCRHCDLVYSNPIPEEAALNSYYSIIAAEKFGGIYGDISDKFDFLVKMSNSRLEKIEQYYKGDKTLLDIGAGIGIFIGTAIDRGWKTEGLELTPEDCKYAIDNYGLLLNQKNFYEFDENISYDVVTLFEVIEHLRTPLKDLKRINKLVKMQGMLVIATPIIDSMYSKKIKEKNVFYNTVTHLSYFSKDVMTKYLQMSGFEILEINLSHEGMGRMEFYCKKISESF